VPVRPILQAEGSTFKSLLQFGGTAVAWSTLLRKEHANNSLNNQKAASEKAAAAAARGQLTGGFGGDRYGDRGDRGGDRYGDRGGDRYGDRGGEPSKAGSFDNRSGGDWRSAPRESAPSARSDGFGERGSRGGFGADRDGFGADRGGFGDRGGDRDSFVRRDDGPPAAERPRLMLAKRSVPVGEPSPNEGVYARLYVCVCACSYYFVFGPTQT